MPSRDKKPTPLPMVPHEDITPLRGTTPDHTWFPCQYCGRMNQCPPVAMPVDKKTTALTRRSSKPGDSVAPELDPDRGADTTKVQVRHTNPRTDRTMIVPVLPDPDQKLPTP